jgi:integrase
MMIRVFSTWKLCALWCEMNRTHVKRRQHKRGKPEADLALYLSAAEVWRAIAACPSDSQSSLFLRALWTTGARVSEVLEVRAEDVRFDERTMRITTLKQRKRAARLVPLPAEFLGELARYIASNGLKSTDRIWPRSRGWAWLVVRRACLAAHVDPRLAHPHSFRHAHVVHALRSSVPLTAIQETVGHASITTTAAYGRLSLVDRRKVYEGAGFGVKP